MPSDYTQEQIETALMAVIAWAGNCAAAARDLDERFPDVHMPNSQLLNRWVNEVHAAEYHRLRDKWSHQLESRLAHEFRDVATRSVQVQSLALARAQERLEKNQDADPAKTAAFAARTGGTAVEKLMTLTNRPEKITEQRDIKEVLRSLSAKGVLEVIPGTAEEQKELPSADRG